MTCANGDARGAARGGHGRSGRAGYSASGLVRSSDLGMALPGEAAGLALPRPVPARSARAGGLD